MFVYTKSGLWFLVKIVLKTSFDIFRKSFVSVREMYFENSKTQPPFWLKAFYFFQKFELVIGEIQAFVPQLVAQTQNLGPRYKLPHSDAYFDMQTM